MKLKNLGFKMRNKNFGTITPEPYDVGKNHFKPTFRSVFVGSAKDGWYVTSNISGEMRLYRHHYTYETEIANIFGLGKTRMEAIENFVSNFTNKTYNVAV